MDNINVFLKINKEIWNSIKPKHTEEKDKDGSGKSELLLVEMQNHPILMHGNAVFCCILREALNYKIAFLDVKQNLVKEIYRSYDQNFLFINFHRLGLQGLITFLYIFFIKSIKILFTSRILDFKIDNIKYGDILYDSYLAGYQLATIKKIKFDFFITLAHIILNHIKFKKTLQQTRPKAILVSHNIGSEYGVLMRVALSLDILVYLRTGGNGKTLVQVYKSSGEIYHDIYRPTIEDINFLSAMDKEELNKDFEKISGTDKRQCIWGDDFKSAFSKQKKIYTSKKQFSDEYGIAPGKKIVFIMLHSFNDHPHSHYGSLFFKDYYDWFAKTLSIAENKKDVIWVFKEHPNSKFYPTSDISLKDHFNDHMENILFLDSGEPFNSYSLNYIADVIITILGTAGVEFPAIGGIPSVIAGNSSYSGYGFTIQPNSFEEYVEVLQNIETIGKLEKPKQDIARIVYLYNQYYSYVQFSCSPMLDYEETKNITLEKYFGELLPEHYKNERENMQKEFTDYVEILKQPDFFRLSKISLYRSMILSSEKKILSDTYN